MADDKTKTGKQDRVRVNGNEPYEVEHFAKQHGLSMPDAREIIEDAGPLREDANNAADREKGKR